jgi:hypothetical protein
MNESLKTVVFVVVAAAVVLAAWASKPSRQAPEDEDVRNQLLYPNFKDPLSVTSLEIVKYDETRGAPQPFKVAQKAAARGESKGKVRWSIPSHDDYPADAKDQVAAAGSSLMGLKVIDKVSDNEGDQQEYGVVDPDPKELKPGATGVGDRVIMKDKAGNELLALIVGKPVPERSDQRYVRKVGSSEIYIVEVKTDKLSAKFEDWIEPNLLQINTMDLKDLLIHDYSLRTTLDGLAMLQSGKMLIGYNEAGEPHWKMLSDLQFVADEKSDIGGKWAPIQMKPNEELNVAKLDGLKAALDDLKIVDVSRKPTGLSADLKVAADFTSDTGARRSLASKGFYALSGELYSNEGEVRVALKNGVVYVLRFGQITGTGPSAKDKDAKKKDKNGEKDKEKKATGLNRYLFVMAEFDPNSIPKPQFEKLSPPAKAKEPEKKPADEKKPDAKKPDEKKPDAAKKAAADKKAEEAQRAAIEKENKRKQEEYDRQIADGNKKVAELNSRFADWYYVISDEVYQKMHLGRDQVVMKKPKKAEKKKGEPAANVEGVEPALPADIMVPGPAAGELEKAKKADEKKMDEKKTESSGKK